MKKSGLFRWRKDQFLKAASAGWFSDRKAELLGGVVYAMTTNPPHMTATLNLEELFRRLLPQAHWFVAREISIEMRNWVPSPDVAIVRGSREQFRHKLPTHTDVALVVEVSDTTYERDRVKKYRKYAALEIPVYWIVDLNRSLIEVHAMPMGHHYLASESYILGDSVPVVLDGRNHGQFLVSDVLP
jgi:Uma2 family endonuclease